MDFRQYWERAHAGTARDNRPFDLYAPVYRPVTAPVLPQLAATAQNQAGLYLQEQAKLGPWILLGSLRHDRVNVRNGGTTTPAEATTGRIGLMYAFENGLTPYVSYATSFNPLFGSLALIGWEDAHWRAQINVQNIADTKYFSSCLARGDCFLGTRRTILGTLTYKF